jgi:hypothetical protein
MTMAKGLTWRWIRGSHGDVSGINRTDCLKPAKNHFIHIVCIQHSLDKNYYEKNMEPNLIAEIQDCVEDLIGYLTINTRQNPSLTRYVFSYENGEWRAKTKTEAGEPHESYYERNLRKLLD